MSTNKTEPFNYARICTRMAHCPVCEQPNRCRLETDEPCNGPCWCDLPTLSDMAMRRIRSDLPEPRCLCENCIECIAADPEITREDLRVRGHHAPGPPEG